MSLDAQRLYELLPAVHRARDSLHAQQLRELIAVIAEQLAVLNEDLEQLYDDLFIETCAPWVVPYIGDLIGYRTLHSAVPQALKARAEVADTIRMRRRKGTAAMLEQLARNATGWDARVVEYFQWLGWSQYMQHLRTQPARGGTLSLRDHAGCDAITHSAGAFDTAARTVDVRSIGGAGAGRHNIRNVGLFLWRLRPYYLARGDAREISPGRFTFNPVGLDTPLFNRPRSETDIIHLADEENVAGPLRRRPLYDELESLRDPAGRPSDTQFFSNPAVFEVRLDAEDEPVPAEQMLICDLSDWHVPANARNYEMPDGTVVTRPIRVAVDPLLGRATVPVGDPVERITVSHASGFSDELGGGPYDRRDSLTPALNRPVTWQRGVSQDRPAVVGEIVATLREAVAAWNEQPAGTVGVITILDNRSYVEDLTGSDKIEIKARSRLVLVGADWPLTTPANAAASPVRKVGDVVPKDVRPHVSGDVSVFGSAAGDEPAGELFVNGLLIEGALTVLTGDLGGLSLAHMTLVPGLGKLVVNSSATDAAARNARLEITLDHSVVGVLRSPELRSRIRIFDSIVSNGTEGEFTDAALDAALAVVDIERSTLLGAVRVAALEARNCLFLGKVETARRQMGCVSFCYVSPDSLVPRRYRCQPDLETAARIQAAEKAAGAPLSGAARTLIGAQVAAAMVPTFTSLRFGAPGYCQLRHSAPRQIRTGADDEAEIGVFHDLFQPQREANLRVRLEEYLRFGLEAGFFHVT